MSYQSAEVELTSSVAMAPARAWSNPLAAVRSPWMDFLCLTLLGYALFGKGWAYLGVSPIYVGEVLLLCGLLSVFLYGNWQALFDNGTIYFLLAMVVWGALRTVPYVSAYGAESLRDAVIWGYSAFAVMVFVSLTAEPERLALLLKRYGYFCWAFLIVSPLAWRVCRWNPALIPDWPWSGSPMIDQKGGDLLVHLAGIMAFWVAGFGGRGRPWRLWLLAGCAAVVGAYNRGGFVSLMAVFALCFVLKPMDRTLWRLLAVGVCGLALLAVTGFSFKTPGKDREVSFDQLASNVWSVASDSGDSRLDNTKEWRLDWWRDIYDYTVRGRYFWTGKGFGVNLADDDGYQGTAWEGKLRSPHNGHLTMLARAGVPGFVLWMLVQLSWAGTMCAAYFRSYANGDQRWSGLFLFLLAYWVAFMANASFDVFIEGPMGGIWFWTIYGAGLAALWIYTKCPEALPDDVDAADMRMAPRGAAIE
jgi:hypothetical protein